jgi:hypothetical protein
MGFSLLGSLAARSAAYDNTPSGGGVGNIGGLKLTKGNDILVSILDYAVGETTSY